MNKWEVWLYIAINDKGQRRTQSFIVNAENMDKAIRAAESQCNLAPGERFAGSGAQRVD